MAVGDLTSDEAADKAVETAVETAVSQLGGIDILINNAAGGSHQNDLTTPATEWLASYDTPDVCLRYGELTSPIEATQ